MRNFFSISYLCPFLILGLISGCGHASTAMAQMGSAPTVDAASFDRVVARLRDEKGAHAVVAGLWIGDQKISSVALGESMTGVPATTDMTIRIGGVSQLFFGTMLMRLVEAGEISLDEKISNWLPDFHGANKVTVGMLANNLGGYKDYVREEAFFDQMIAEPFRTFTREELLAFSVADGEFNFEPGTSQAYSHTEFIILREVLERATERSIDEMYQTEIFDPLGLTRTGYQTTPELPSPVLHAFSSERGVYEDSTFWNPSWASDSGPLYSTLEELGKWGPAFGQGRLLQWDSFQQLIKRPDVAPPTGPYFATGFVVANGWYFQNPNFNGYTGALGYNSALDMTIVVYATQPEVPKVEAIGFEIFQGLIEEFAPDHPLSF